MSTLELKELSHPAGEVIKIAAGKTLDLKSQGSVTMPTGSVLQVIQTVKTDTFSTTVSDTTFVAVSGLAATITPSAATSKVLVTVAVTIGTTVGDRTTNFRLLEGATALGLGDAAGSRVRVSFSTSVSASNARGNASYTFLASPSTTSAVTYSIEMSGHAGNTHTINEGGASTDNTDAPWARSSSTITLMEIQG